MKIIRWLLCFPGALLASVVAWMLVTELFDGVHSSYGGGYFYSLVGLLPLLTKAAFPTATFVVSGICISPSQERNVCFVFFGLSLLVSAGGIESLRFLDGAVGFWLASASGVLGGAIIGLVAALRIQRKRRPIQPPEPMSGLAPGHGSP